jgi:gluconate 2-dehydrogenase gamma chain
MAIEDKIDRRTVLKGIAVGVGAVNALPILENSVLGQQRHPGMDMGQGPGSLMPAAKEPRFFNAQELATITAISDLIIPADEHSPGAKDGGVPGFIDLMVSESPPEVKLFWRDGLAAIERMSEQKFSSGFTSASPEQQISLLKSISRNERRARTIEERFFVAIKSMTVDGYYTSQIGIHQELQYKGNAYLKEFVGCTHPEHSS